MNPFGSRNITQILILGCIGFFGMAIFGIGPLISIGILFYWSRKRKKQASACSDIIKNRTGKDVIHIEEAYHPKQEWGFIAMTERSFIFIPKAGDAMFIPLSDINQYGCKSIGTGEFITTVSQLPGTNMNVGSTRENKVPVFYFERYNGDLHYWYVSKIDSFYKILNDRIGTKVEKKVNY